MAPECFNSEAIHVQILMGFAEMGGACTRILKKSISSKESRSPLVRQQNAILMAFCWRANDDTAMNVSCIALCWSIPAFLRTPEDFKYSFKGRVRGMAF